MTERMERLGRGLASLALLAGLLVGVPAALLALGGDPLPRTLELRALVETLLQPDDGTVLARLLALVGWLAWAMFVLTLLLELVNLLRHRRHGVVLPGLGVVQQWAAGLVLAVLAMGAASQLAGGPAQPGQAVARAADTGRDEAATSSDPTAAAAPGTERSPSPAGGAAEATPVPAPGSELSTPEASTTGPSSAPAVPLAAPHGQRQRVHVVEAGDDLWSLAEHYYGQGREWRRIARANPELLTGGPDRLRVGWRLVVPAEQADPVEDGAPQREVEVRPGDTLSAIADRELGDASRWREVYRANRDQLSDPDELPEGLLLRLPGRPVERTARPDSDAPVPASDHAASSPQAPTRSRPDPPEAVPPAPVPPASVLPAPIPSTTEASSDPSPLPSPAATDVEPAPTAEDDEALGVLVPGLATVGGLLAAGLVGGLAARRRWQLQRRPLGRRVAHPAPATRPLEVALARRARPIGLRTLDRASRAVAAASAEARVPVPGLRSASVSAEWLVLELDGPTPPAPRCFVDTGGTWCLAADAVDGLRTVPGLGEAPRPWPLLVTLGTDEEGAERVVDLESRGLLLLDGSPEQATAVMAAIALELACAPWTDELGLILVGDERLGPALAQHNVDTCDDLEVLLRRWERLARGRDEHSAGRPARDLRLDPDRAEAWAPQVALVDAPVSADHARRLAHLTASGLGLTAVVRGPLAAEAATLAFAVDGRATLLPDGVRLVPQSLAPDGLDGVLELVGATGSEETSPAPWWSSERPPEAPPDNVTYLGDRRRTEERDEQERRAAVQARMTEAADGVARHPLLRLIGPVELVGAAGTPPSRAAKQCLEYCAWLLENPGTTAQAMAAGLLVAEGTRRSNMSRLRTWLGTAADGEPYLPDAYSGRIWLDPVVSSDWHQLRLLLADGVDVAPTSVLELGLRLVRGAPFADAAPVQWHWAEELRTDIVSCVRDIGVELARRAREERQLDLARWATARALAAAPGDELLMTSRIRTEHLAGNTVETERLCLQLAQHARALGMDLAPETVDLLQEVMEGRLRARFA